MNHSEHPVKAAQSTLGVAIVGLGSTTSTLLAGLSLVKNRHSTPIGSLAEMGHVDGQPIRDLVDLAPLENLEFMAWDPYKVNALESAKTARVLRPEQIELVQELAEIEAKPAVFDPTWVNRLVGTDNVRIEPDKMAQADALIADLREFGERCDRVVVLWSASTEAYRPTGPVHTDIASFELGLKSNDPTISPSQIYAYAALKAGYPYINGSPNVSSDVPALMELAELVGVPIAGKDYKTGQTLMKTIVAPGLRSRRLGVAGWFSTNILGNRDGMVLDEPDNFRSKEVTKLGVLEDLLKPEEHPDLYGDISHMVRINYYPPKGDDKEGWDHIDLFGWLGYPMQLKIDFLCRDSILAAPVMLDLILFTDLAARAGWSGVQEWLSFYVKDPLTRPGETAIHGLAEQEQMLFEALRKLAS
ncbi:MAG: inositol-3-phosphate synthase [Acidimicrobiia bacterium]|nr:inositol-3-phosphate synthase [Acidimicrobiia bacterium]